MTTPAGAEPVVLVLMGVSGSGKSTAAASLAAALGWDVEEGDELHPAANVAKMRAGQALTDADRGPWLAKVAAWITAHTSSGRPGIITCSALKREYRDVLRGEHVVFVHLRGTRDEIAARLASRRGHFMPAALLDSQLAALEPPGADERSITVSIASPAAEIVQRLGLRRLPSAGADRPR